MSTPSTTRPAVRGVQPAAVTGVQLMQGIGHAPSQGFWLDAWNQVRKRPMAVVAMCWVGFMVFFALFAPLLASGHPLWMVELDEQGRQTGDGFSPWLRSLSAADAVLLIYGVLAVACAAVGLVTRRWKGLLVVTAGVVPAMLTLLVPSILQTGMQGRDPAGVLLWARNAPNAGWIIGALSAAGVCVLCMLVPVGLQTRAGSLGKFIVVLVACAASAWIVSETFKGQSQRYTYIERETSGEIRATYTLIPFSPDQRFTSQDRRPPGSTLAAGREVPADSPAAEREFALGSDAFGGDVLTQLIHAARLALSIGVVSTGIALLIGVTMGALMGYFGGWVDLLLFRVVEIFMAVPVLFLLIVTVGILPPEWRNTYVTMAIVGCFTWTGMARFTRAEFLKLRNQDFVQSAKAVGLPLRSILFKHMLPNGVAPVLVDTSFAVAAAISLEAVLSYLGLGPPGQASWGKLLSSAVSAEGVFKWWLAVFPGAFIFLTVLSYNIVGEALRDAIDPKLKKARV